MNEELKKIIMTTGDLPPMPMVATKVIQLVESGKANAEEIARAISSDPAVSARLMKISNSAFYGRQRKIETLASAVVILGHNTLMGLVVAASLCEAPGPCRRCNPEAPHGASRQARGLRSPPTAGRRMRPFATFGPNAYWTKKLSGANHKASHGMDWTQ